MQQFSPNYLSWMASPSAKSARESAVLRIAEQLRYVRDTEPPVSQKAVGKPEPCVVAQGQVRRIQSSKPTLQGTSRNSQKARDDTDLEFVATYVLGHVASNSLLEPRVCGIAADEIGRYVLLQGA